MIPLTPADISNCLVVVKPDLFMSVEDFKNRMGYLYRHTSYFDRVAGVGRSDI
ncbi:hypothetical protein BKA63DRAFT_523481 [Paraphoma chrysanthemicola]|nr:hypothetical protein BKA63DRAFT_523481 [Paraphoma chrysanthemicola]